jgi:succinate dehydrogenase flavin-adding protein (antitoxin of CptAB toxin-antitoxin module)
MFKKIKKFIIKLLLDKEIEKELIDLRIIKYFDEDGFNFSAEDTERLWKKIAKENPILYKWISSRQNFLLKQIWVNSSNPEILRAIALEWEVIKKIIEKEDKSVYNIITKDKEDKKTPNVEEIKQKLKELNRA